MTAAHDSALEVLKQIRKAGFTACFAGGCVRDRLLGREAQDYDIATDARPEQIEALFPKTVAVGKAFGVMVVVHDGIPHEVATFRADHGCLDGRRPEHVEFCGIEEDAKRRDFTINGMFYDPETDEVIDYVGGRADLAAGIIRAIGDPDARFAEDRLRMLRAVRFAHTLGFAIEPRTRDAIRVHAAGLAGISAERIETEFSRILTESRRAGDAVRELVELGLMAHIIPELLPLIGQEQPPQFHPEGDVFEHTVLMLNLIHEQAGMPAQSASFRKLLAYTVLLHDIGKPATAVQAEDRLRFHGHDRKGAEMAEEILRRLKLPAKEIKAIVAAVGGHMRFMEVQRMKRSTLRRLMGAETFDLEMELHRLDCEASHGMLDNYDFLLDEIRQMRSEPALPAPWVTGKDLIALGVRPGPRLGALLRQGYDAQLEGRFETRDALLDWLKTEM